MGARSGRSHCADGSRINRIRRARHQHDHRILPRPRSIAGICVPPSSTPRMSIGCSSRTAGTARRATRWKRLRPSRRRSSASKSASASQSSMRPAIDDRRSTSPTRSGRSARGWNRCDERRCHGERPPWKVPSSLRNSRAGSPSRSRASGAASMRRGSMPTRCRSSTAARRARFAFIPAATTARLGSKSAG